MKKKETGSTTDRPNSVCHYSSFEALTHILDVKNECLRERKMMNFHFGNPLQTNDKKEVHFFQDYVYTQKEGQRLKNDIDRIKENIGDPFILSLMHQQEDKSTYPRCEIPMWKMYGDNFSGIRLKFDFRKLKKHCEDIEGIDLIKCKYCTITEMKERGREIRKSSNNGSNYSDLVNLYKEAVSFKTYNWIYENEWRIVAWCKDINKIDFLETSGRLFINQEIPLDCLEAIEIGPKADQIAIEGSLSLIKKKIGNIPENHFIIKKSKIQIGYV